jgi:hypothetical protein
MTYMTCARFDDQLAALLEGELPGEERMAVEAHVATCARCGQLLADVRGIVRDAAVLPELTPSRDLWDGIAARIQAPVVELEHRQARGVVRRGPSWRLAAAAAAVLVALTALTTWQLAVDSDDPAAPVERVAATAPASQPDASTDSVEIASVPGDAVRRTTSTPRTANPAAPAPVTAVRNATRPAVASLYDREIESLRTMLNSRRDQLDTATIRVLEENLTIIDRAIEQSRQALARDPNSTFLTDHLNDALGRKVELLRTATLLQSSS